MSENEDRDRYEGIYRKYNVKRLADPCGKHDDCFYFVLDPKHDKFAVTALRAYAIACASEFPQLAIELNAIVQKHTDHTMEVIRRSTET